MQGLLSDGREGLIIGKSSNYKRKFKGVIDADYTGIIKVMIQPLKETNRLHKNQKNNTNIVIKLCKAA